MEYFLSIAGERSGPFSQFQFIERIREGTLTGTELAWRKGEPEWQPLRRMDEFAPYWPLTEDQLKMADEARRIARVALDTPRPWLRFWARMIDYLWFAMAVGLLLGFVMPDQKMLLSGTQEAQILAIAIGCLIILLFVPVEAWCLSRYGTTPGKALLRIQVGRLEGGLPTFQQAMRRALLVYIKGVALWLPLLPLFTMSFCRVRLLQKGATSWDEDCQTRVEHGEPEIWRFLLLSMLLFIMFFVTVAAMLMATLQMNHEMMDALRSNLPK